MKSNVEKPGNSAATSYNRETYEYLWSYGHFQRPQTSPWWPAIETLACHAKDKLEIGPGLIPKLPVHGTHVVDLSVRALDSLEKQGAIVHRTSLSETAFADKSFDLVALFEILEHVEDDQSFLGEISRITRERGRLALSVPMGMRNWTAWDDFSGHARRYEPAELRLKIERAGFTIDAFECHGGVAGISARLLAGPSIWVVRRFPRVALTIFERLVLRCLRLTRLHWKDCAEWGRAGQRGSQCTLICSRCRTPP